MNSLYDISQDFLNIFNEIEENDGELTPELEKQLKITRENYNTKGEVYCKIIKQYENYINEIKEEKARLDKRKKVLENRIKRLKDRLLDAINQFGPIETSLFKIGTRKSNSIEINSNRLHTLNTAIIKFAKEIHNNGLITFGEDNDIEGMLDVINANLKAENEYDKEYGITDKDFIPFTIQDLEAAKINISNESNIYDLFKYNAGMLEAVLNNEAVFNIEDVEDKTYIKELSKVTDNITIAKVKTDNNLSIR